MKRRVTDTTICIIDSQTHELAVRAMRACLNVMEFDDALFISDQPYPDQDSGVRSTIISAFKGRSDYSRFVMKELVQHVLTKHVLLIQWDGYIVNPEAWSDDFLDYDYIGARWGFHQDAHNVGNGGFSLRSRKLLEALQDVEIQEFEPEDAKICRQYRSMLEARHGIRFAPPEVADRFSFETIYPEGMPFGFHGLFNMWLFLDDTDVSGFVAAMPGSILGSIQALSLVKNFIDLKRTAAARTLLKARLDRYPADAKAAGMLSSLDQVPQSTPQGNTRPGRNDPCPCGSGKRYKHCCGSEGAQSSPGNTPAPASAQSVLEVAMNHHQNGRLSEARAAYEAVLAMEDHPYALHYLGVVDMQDGQPEAAETRIRASLQRVPDNPDFLNNLGLTLRAQGRLDEAVVLYRQALDLNPSYAPAWSNTGLDLHKLGRIDEALDAFNRALALDPNLPQTRFSRALALLAKGLYAQGWAEYEWRQRCPEYATNYRLPSLPGQPRPWQGEPLAGKRLLLIAEQGIGDTLQFIRYANILSRQGSQVSLLCSKPHIVDFVRTNPSLSAVYSLQDAAHPPVHDYFCHLLSLPRLCGTQSTSDVPWEGAYLFAPEPARATWRARLAALPQRLKIGLAWSGSPGNPDDRHRSLHLRELATLFELADIAWISLQLGPGREHLQALTNPILDWGDDQTDYATTAALLAELDLIITVDTSIAHAAGTLGRPVWILLSHMPDFRWMLERHDSPWYPTARLFRQPRPGDWSAVAEAVLTTLMRELSPGKHP